MKRISHAKMVSIAVMLALAISTVFAGDVTWKGNQKIEGDLTVDGNATFKERPAVNDAEVMLIGDMGIKLGSSVPEDGLVLHFDFSEADGAEAVVEPAMATTKPTLLSDRMYLSEEETILETNEIAMSSLELRAPVMSALSASDMPVLNDQSSLQNDGAVYNAIPSAGKTGGGYYLDGDNDYIRVPNSASMEIRAQLTVAVWVKPETFGPGGYGNESAYVVNKGRDLWWNPTFYLGYSKGSNSSQPKWPAKAGPFPAMFNICNETGAQRGGGKRVTGVTLLNAGEWYHIAGTYDGMEAKLYVNGVLDAVEPYSGLLRSDNAPVLIGGGNLGSTEWGNHFTANATVDDVVIFNRALSATEIINLFKSKDTDLLIENNAIIRGDMDLTGGLNVERHLAVNGTNIMDAIAGIDTTPPVTNRTTKIFFNSISIGKHDENTITGNALAFGGSFVQGASCDVSGVYSHAEGYDAIASGPLSHAVGYGSEASGLASHASGWTAVAGHDFSYVWSGGMESAITESVESSAHREFTVYAEGGVRLLGGNKVLVDGDLSATGDVTAMAFHGDGSHLTGIDVVQQITNTTTEVFAQSVNVNGDMHVAGSMKVDGQDVATEAYVDSSIENMVVKPARGNLSMGVFTSEGQ